MVSKIVDEVSVSAATVQISRTGAAVSLLLLGLAAVFAGYYQEKVADTAGISIPVEKLPMTFGDWDGREGPGLGVRSAEILQLDHYVKRFYRNSNGDEVFVYVGYWNQQTGEHQAAKHAPVICLPANGWRISDVRKRVIPASAIDMTEPLQLQQLVGSFQQENHLFFFWFFSGKQTYIETWFAMVQIGLSTFFEGRSDGGIVEISARIKPTGDPAADLARTEQILDDFTASFYKEIYQLIAHPGVAADDA